MKNIQKYLIILIGSIVWTLTMFRSGLMGSSGINFFGANGHDGIWHLAVINSLSSGNLENPVMAGETIKNYHIGFDVLVALLHKITTIDISILYFQILPFIFSFLIGLLVYQFVFNWKKDETKSLWATSFVYFSGSLGFLVTLYKDGVVSGESVFWSQQSVSTLINPPFALSLVLILSGLIAVQKKKILLPILLFGILLQIKAYAAILVLAGLFAVAFYSYFILNTKYYIQVFIGSLILNVILLFAIPNDNVSVFSFMPFWFLETMMSYGDRLGIEKYYSAMTNYKLGYVYFKLVASYTVALSIFLIGNMGLRIISAKYYLDLLKKKIKLDYIDIFITTILFVSVLIPMFFVQVGTPWNTIQFFYYFLFFTAIISGIILGGFIKDLKVQSKYIVYILIVFIFSINAWVTLQHYLPKVSQAILPKEEVEALLFLKKLEDGTILTYPFDEYRAKEAANNPPRPLYLYESTAYVAYYSDKKMFLGDEVNSNIMGYDWKNRRKEILNFFATQDKTEAKKFLKDNNIRYLYLTRDNPNSMGSRMYLSPGDLDLDTIYENPKISIYEYKLGSI